MHSWIYMCFSKMGFKPKMYSYNSCHVVRTIVTVPMLFNFCLEINFTVSQTSVNSFS